MLPRECPLPPHLIALVAAVAALAGSPSPAAGSPVTQGGTSAPAAASPSAPAPTSVPGVSPPNATASPLVAPGVGTPTAPPPALGSISTFPKFFIGSVTVPHTNVAPAIDGTLDDPTWQAGAVVRLTFDLRSHTPAGDQTSARLLTDGQFLYVG